MLDRLIDMDQKLLLALNGSDSLFMDGLMWTFTHTLTWIPLIAGLVYVVMKNHRLSVCFTVILGAVLLVAFTDQFSSTLCKPYFHRLRPTHTPELAAAVDVVRGYRGGLYGFFSNHAANTFGTAMFFTLVFRHAPTGALLFGWAALSSYTRIYLGVHFPLDITCGALFGMLSGIIFWYVCHRICRSQPLSSDYSTSVRTVTGYAKSDFSIVFLTASISLAYALTRAVILASSL